MHILVPLEKTKKKDIDNFFLFAIIDLKLGVSLDWRRQQQIVVVGRCNYILCMLQPLFSDTNGSMASNVPHAILFVRVVGYCYT